MQNEIIRCCYIQSDYTISVAKYSKYLAKPSFSQVWFHHEQVTKLPNH